MTGRLAGEVAVVTGGAQGIGEAVVEKFLAEGARVAFLDRDADRGHAVAARLGPDVAFHECDITAREQVDRAFARVTETYGRIGLLVNNAGVSAYFDAVEMTDSEWDTVFAVDLKGVWLCTRGVLAGMRAAGSGSIVNVSSIHARMTTTGMFPYAAAKAGASGLTRSLALDEGPHGIRVNAVCPGYTRTQLVQEYIDRQPDPAAAESTIVGVHPLGRIATPAEIAAVWTNAPASLTYHLGGRCTRLTADLGIDDSMREHGDDRGSVVYRVLVDGTAEYTSPRLTGSAPSTPIGVDVSGASVVELAVDDGGDGKSYDHADWAGARLACG